MNDPSSSNRLRRTAIQPEEACSRILGHIRPLEPETLPIGEVWNRHLTGAAEVPHPYPPFRRSAMDGFAVRAEDLRDAGPGAPAELEVVESVLPGDVPKRVVSAGQACRIMTGAMMPEGADTVVILEMTVQERRGDRTFVRVGSPVQKGRNAADIGSELRAGQKLFEPGRRIGAGETALLASLGMANVSVVRKPRVGVLSTGTELLSPEEPLVPGKIRNSNTLMLAALLREAGAEPVLYGQAPDHTDEVEERIRRSLSACDMLLTSGGVSVGDSDVLVDVLARWEGQTLFNKVAMRPGSPTTAAVLGGKVMLALSGNPGACFTGFHLFAAPAIRAMLRNSRPEPAVRKARLAEPFTKVNAYPRYIRSRSCIRDGTLWAAPAGPDQSGLMTTIPDTDCLIRIPPLKEPLEAGTLVDILPLKEGFPG